MAYQEGKDCRKQVIGTGKLMLADFSHHSLKSRPESRANALITVRCTLSQQTCLEIQGVARLSVNYIEGIGARGAALALV